MTIINLIDNGFEQLYIVFNNLPYTFFNAKLLKEILVQTWLREYIYKTVCLISISKDQIEQLQNK